MCSGAQRSCLAGFMHAPPPFLLIKQACGWQHTFCPALPCLPHRNKLTKLAGNKTERRKLNKQIQGLLQEQLLGKAGKQKQQVPQASTAGDGMAD